MTRGNAANGNNGFLQLDYQSSISPQHPDLPRTVVGSETVESNLKAEDTDTVSPDLLAVANLMSLDHMMNPFNGLGDQASLSSEHAEEESNSESLTTLPDIDELSHNRYEH